jgi:pimeloyl-ACP methyl ester carboxylesterase
MADVRGRAWRTVAGVLLLAGLAGAGWVWRHRPRPITVTAGQYPEELVYARSTDDVINGGTFFSTSKRSAQGVAVIWVHGWGTNFYYPTYTMIGRALAARGLTTISVNTRMHDLGTSAAHRMGRRVRGGGYWGIPSEQDLDIAAWVTFAGERGYSRVVLAGHSAGWAAVAAYRVRTQDPRVAGIVLASGTAQAMQPLQDKDVLDKARRLVDEGLGDDLIRLPNRSFPSYISAATQLDQANTPPDLLDFFGQKSAAAGVTRLNCPLLALYGTRGDVGGESDLELVRSAPARLSIKELAVETRMIDGADHMYTGEEAQVAAVISDWANRVLSASR